MHGKNWKTERLDEGMKSSLVLYRRIHSDVPGSAAGWEKVAYEEEFCDIRFAMWNPDSKEEPADVPEKTFANMDPRNPALK